MNRRSFLRQAGATIVGLCSGAFESVIHADEATGRTKPNILFVMCDDLGWGDLGCFGNQAIKTPNIDRIAAQGLRVANFYVNSPVCSPSRTAMMTGHFPARHRVHNALGTSTEFNQRYQQADYVDPKHHTLYRLLQSGGYVTGHFGKWHMGSTPEAPPPERYGLDESLTHCSTGDTWRTPDVPQDKYTERLIDLTIDFVERHQNDTFYVNCCLWDPHSILTPSRQQMTEYSHLSVPEPAKGRFSSATQTYYSVVTDIDKHVGRLLDRLDDLGIADNTMVVFCSDNGPAPIWGIDTIHSGAGSAGPMRGVKSSLYEGGIRTPFIVRWPGNTPRNAVDNKSIVSGVDLLPTFCSIAGVELPADYNGDGEDMSNVLAGRSKSRTKALMWEYRDGCWGRDIQDSPALAIREGKWKLMMNPDGSRLVLYDLNASPCEVDSLADTHPEVAQALAKRLMDWHTSLPDHDTILDSVGSFSYPWPRSGDL